MKRSLIALVTSAGVFVCGLLSITAPREAEARSFVAPDKAKVIALGKALFYDKTLSEPAGMACVTCHDPETGYSYPISVVNWIHGTVPGVIPTRFGNRKPPSAAYTPFFTTGTPRYDKTALAFVGGLFWDGRAADSVIQARGPFLKPNEMNVRAHGMGSPELVIEKLRNSPSAKLFVEAYGAKALAGTPARAYALLTRAIAEFEASPEVSPFTSKYDAYLEGKAQLTGEELLGLRLATGFLNGRQDGLPFRKSAHCMDCHVLSKDLSKAPDLFTNSCYANLGVPKNPWNPYYKMTDAQANPAGHNREGDAYVDLGMGAVLYPLLGLSPGGFELGDPLRINGTFKAPSLRNVDKRPNPGFVKAYMHNGAFKSLKQVVHFYNTRNLTTYPGEVIDFSQPDPYANLKGKPLWPKPEYMNPNSLINATGMAAGLGSRAATSAAPVLDLDAQQIGNLMLSDFQEDAIVAFLKTLTDGYFKR